MNGLITLLVMVLLASNAFGQAVIASLWFNEQDRTVALRYHQITGRDTLLIAEFVFLDGRVKSPARG